MDQKKIRFLFYFSLLLLAACNTVKPTAISSALSKEIFYQSIQTHIFDSPQKIAIVAISNEDQNGHWGVAYSRDSLRKTSDFAITQQAATAINGGFFDMQKGGSVTYLEVGGEVINFTIDEKERWAKASPIVNGALIVGWDNKIEITSNRGGSYYQRSDQEKAVLITGPLLLQKGKRTALGDSDFIRKRHPRSCVCVTTDQRTLLIAVDGRQSDAAGMSLPELQEYLLLKNCKDAINLDGGGSTTLWMRERGIINSPSDKKGERSVANVLYFIP